jgi:hypothetical protein
MINEIDPSPFEKGGAYVAATMYKSDDQHPYLYKTNDYGKTWTKIVDGIPSDRFTRVVRADPKKRGLLFAGTEWGMYVSFDDGAHWQSLQLKLPIVSITDLQVRDDSLIAATQGRGFWMLDDIEPLRQIADVAAKPVHLFKPPATWRTEGGGGRRAPRLEGTNPPNGAIVDYVLRDQKPGTKVSLAFLDPAGKVMREYKGEVQKEAPKPREVKATDTGVKSEGAAEEKPASDTADDKKKDDDDKLADVVNGHNRFNWDLRYAPAKKFEGLIMWSGRGDGPSALPGTYNARLTVGDQVVSVPFEVKQEPRTTASAADLKSQFDFVLGVRDKLTEIDENITRIRDVRKSLADVKKRVGDNKTVVDAAKELDKKMTAVEEALYQTKNKSSQDPLNYPIRLNDKLAGVGDAAASGYFAPAAQQIAVRDELVKQIDEQLAKLKVIFDTDLPAFNKLVREQNVPAIK